MKTDKSHSYKLVTEFCYNPFYLECDSFRVGELNSIKFFDNEDVKYSTRWFASAIKGKFGLDIEKYPIGTNCDFSSIDLPFTNIPLRRKVNLSKDDAFIVSASSGSYKKYDLYIKIDKIPGFVVKQVKLSINDIETREETRVCFPVEGVIRHYNGIEGERFAIFSCNYVFKPTEQGDFCKKVAELINKDFFHKCSDLEVSYLIKSGNLFKLRDMITEYENSKK